MYEKILNDPLLFGPEIGDEAKDILTRLLTRDPSRRLGVNGAEEIKRHPFFHNHIDFGLLARKKIQPPFKPSVASPVVREAFSLSTFPPLSTIIGCLQL
jgi:serum/glucocorticoid-regulated kinase 2